MVSTEQAVQAIRSRRQRRQSTARRISLRRRTHSPPRGHPLRHAATASPATPRRAPPSMPKSTPSCTTTPSASPESSERARLTPTPQPTPTPAQGPSTRAARSITKQISPVGYSCFLMRRMIAFRTHACYMADVRRADGWSTVGVFSWS